MDYLRNNIMNTLPDHSWIKLYVNIPVGWSGGPLNRPFA